MTAIFDRPILIVGFGSIGRRHLRNLQALGHKKFVLYRTGKSTLPLGEIADIPVEYDLKKALAHKPAATIVSNPTSEHISVALAAAKAGSHIFLEKPISNSFEGIDELRRIARRKKLVVQVGFQFRFNEDLERIKRRLIKKEIGPIVSVQAHWGEYLPDWHPWEDYRLGYAAQKRLGGGVLLTLCHPFDYLRWLIGNVESVFAQESRDGGLKLDVEDSADVLLRFKSGEMGNVHLDYLERPAAHFVRIIGQKGIIRWDYPGDEGKRNKMFLLEMKHFLTCIKENKQPLCTLEDGIEALKIVLSAKESARKGKLIRLNK